MPATQLPCPAARRPLVLEYRPAQPEDIEPLYAFNKALIDAYEDKTQIDYEKVLAWVRRKLERYIPEYSCIYVDGCKAGYYHFYAPDSEVMELDDLYLYPAFRGRGIGTAVIQSCCARTSKPVILCAFIKNTRALALYRRLGFRVLHRTFEVSDTRCILRQEAD